VTELRSHPELLLREHVEQVEAAVQCVWARHSSVFRANAAEVREWLALSVRMHDVGKANASFQEYIRDPSRYRGRRADKSHTPLSLLSALAYAQEADWSWQQALAVAVAAACHHGGWRTRVGLEHVLAFGENDAALQRQVATVPWEAVRAETGLDLVALQPEECLTAPGLDALEQYADALCELPTHEAIGYRLRAQLCLSVLLEADKALLAIKPEYLERYFDRRAQRLEPALVDRFLTTKPTTPLDGLRRRARELVLSATEGAGDARVQTVTLPTGSGKTLLAASWALRLREQLAESGHAPKIVVVLPYLSIIDQTQDEYRRMFGEDCAPDLLLQSHSLSERVFDSEMDGDTNDFFVDTWQSDLVITTFDQLLFSLLAPEARHQMRFHNLCDALIVMDEIQTLPCKLWDPVASVLDHLTRMGNTRILAMSATQPGFLRSPQELTPDPSELYGQLSRYVLKLRHRETQSLEEFVAEVLDRLSEWEGKRVLLTFNTRRSARAVRDVIAERMESAAPEEPCSIAPCGRDPADQRRGQGRGQAPMLQGTGEVRAPLFFLTADVTPGDRLDAIVDIKKGNPCVVVSTQCIEAGVDIDMDYVTRDFAPLDSLIQVAGRCNRNASKDRCTVEIVSLKSDRGRSFAQMVYDDVLLQATRTVLGSRESVNEEDILTLTEQYFRILKDERDLGEAFTRAWAYWEDSAAVRSLLRGDRTRQVTFVVIERDPELVPLLDEVAEIDDRWEKRRALRRLAGRIARVSVSLYARPTMDPADYACLDPTGRFWLLRPGYYHPATGLQLARPEEEESWGWMM
jgi:CRISPR-associated endonuclease/helicase Cas3